MGGGQEWLTSASHFHRMKGNEVHLEEYLICHLVCEVELQNISWEWGSCHEITKVLFRFHQKDHFILVIFEALQII